MKKNLSQSLNKLPIIIIAIDINKQITFYNNIAKGWEWTLGTLLTRGQFGREVDAYEEQMRINRLMRYAEQMDKDEYIKAFGEDNGKLWTAVKENGLPDDLPNLYGPVTYDMIGKPVDTSKVSDSMSSDQERGQTAP